MKLIRSLLLLSSLVFAAALSGCVHLNSVSQTQIPSERGKTVRAEASRFIFLGFNFDNDYVDSITSKLRSQCPSGAVRGILTKDESINYFLFIFHSRRITAEGFCVKA